MRNVKLFFVVVLISVCFINNVRAFRPVGHVLVKNKVVESLGNKNKFTAAMKRYPHIAAWGAVGPDLGYNVDNSRFLWAQWKRRMKNSMLFADIAHYNKVGDFIKNFERAIESEKDTAAKVKLRAFLGGWITHVAGDFGSHGIYVKPEAGFYIASESGRELHGELEKIADTYLYYKYASKTGLSGMDFNIEDYWEQFFGTPGKYDSKAERKQTKAELKTLFRDSKIEETLSNVYRQTYELEPKFDLTRLTLTYYRAEGAGLGKFFGFVPVPFQNMMELVKVNNRLALIDSAFNQSVKLASYYLQALDKQDTEIFKNNWNLDIGPEATGTYIIKIEPGRSMVSRTKNKLYAQFIDSTHQVKSPRKLINIHLSAMMFAHYQKDTYYYHLNMSGALGELDNWKPGNATHIVFTLLPKSIFHNKFRVRKISVTYDGKPVATTDSLQKKKRCCGKKSSTVTLYKKPMILPINPGN